MAKKERMSSFDKALESLKPQDARQWQEFKNVDWMRQVWGYPLDETIDTLGTRL